MKHLTFFKLRHKLYGPKILLLHNYCAHVFLLNPTLKINIKCSCIDVTIAFQRPYISSALLSFLDFQAPFSVLPVVVWCCIVDMLAAVARSVSLCLSRHNSGELMNDGEFFGRWSSTYVRTYGWKSIMSSMSGNAAFVVITLWALVCLTVHLLIILLIALLSIHSERAPQCSRPTNVVRRQRVQYCLQRKSNVTETCYVFTVPSSPIHFLVMTYFHVGLTNYFRNKNFKM